MHSAQRGGHLGRMDRRGRGDQSVISLSAPGRGRSLAAYSCGIQGLVAAAAVWASGPLPPGASPEARRSRGLASRLPPPELPGRSHLAVTPAGSRASHDPTSGDSPPEVVPGPWAQTLATHPGHSALAVRGEAGLVRLGLCCHWLAAGQSSAVYPGARQRPSLKAGRRRPRKGGAVPGSARYLVRSPFFLSFLFSPGGQIKKLEIRSRRPDAHAKILNKSPRDI